MLTKLLSRKVEPFHIPISRAYVYKHEHQRLNFSNLTRFEKTVFQETTNGQLIIPKFNTPLMSTDYMPGGTLNTGDSHKWNTFLPSKNSGQGRIKGLALTTWMLIKGSRGTQGRKAHISPWGCWEVWWSNSIEAGPRRMSASSDSW